VLEIWTEKDGVPATLHPDIPPDGRHEESVADFLEAVRTTDATHHRGWQGLARARVVDACYASAEAGREITLG